MGSRKKERMGEIQQFLSSEEFVRNREQSRGAIGRGRYVVKEAYC